MSKLLMQEKIAENISKLFLIHAGDDKSWRIKSVDSDYCDESGEATIIFTLTDLGEKTNETV